ncbi:holo-ACP synthase [Alicyclobacillus pomorum]|uniref:holo-ACP synthase n=1 Tax=Alicyclobacillus pomorum TaxID=204470 RepID=UPI0003FC6D72|nr:holo-ACP synthase [Alicyclobacillus pomorum]
MLLGLGTDLVDIGRIRAAYERQGDRLLQRILAPNERIQCANVSVERMVEFLAGRFAAKEAIAKAAGCGIGRLRMNLVELVVGQRGLQVRFLHSDLPQEFRGRWSVSVTHTSTMAFATAILEADPDE